MLLAALSIFSFQPESSDGAQGTQTPAPPLDTAARADSFASAQSAAPFILGADISWVQQREDEGRQFTDNGAPKDIFAIFQEHGFNWIRLRLFNDPSAPKGYSSRGYCDLPHTVAMAKRIKAAGMRFLLDFHYSDTWADPGKQFKPAAWQDLGFDDLAKALRDYTRDAILEFKRQETLPDMVQIGNEINHGFLWPDGTPKDWDKFAALLKAAIKGVKDADPTIKIMLHIACGGQNEQSRQFLDNALQRGIEFDLIGESYYPRWHGTLEDLRSNLNDLAARYKQDLIVVEYSVPNVREINDIVHRLPDGKGLGTFIWEPTNGALFDRKGSAKPELDEYPKMAKEYRKE
jgi:arabinogalactan endo-1,4-beta-galactosidase